jgi:release factor glutamine methyltransferase
VTVAEALSAAGERLRERSPSARLDAVRMLEAVVGREPAWLFAHGDDELDARQSAVFAAATERRAGGEPVAYITGRAGFFGRTFGVTPDVLVPRPESELLVELVLAALRARERAAPSILDVGTGSGALAVTLALELPRARVVAADVSPAALEVAEGNARALGVAARVQFVSSDLTANVPRSTRFDAIVANLPYVPTSELALAPDPTAFEPRLALDGGADGLALYRRLLSEAPGLLASPATLVLEAAPPTANGLAALCADAFGPGAGVRVLADLAGLERAIVVETGGRRAPGANATVP